MTYQEWVNQNYPTPEKAYGECEEATSLMAEAFPELRRVKGHFICPDWGKRAHWWCVDPQGNIVDPTAAQFPFWGFAGDYEEALPDTLVQVGVCMDCGSPIEIPLSEAEKGARGPTFCSQACERATLAYLSSPQMRW
jgi:hypothetical protein